MMECFVKKSGQHLIELLKSSTSKSEALKDKWRANGMGSQRGVIQSRARLKRGLSRVPCDTTCQR